VTYKPYVAAYDANSRLYLNSNWAFTAYPASPGYPTGWTLNAGAPAAQQGAGGVGVQLTGPANGPSVIVNQVGTFAGPGWYIVEFMLTLGAGSLVGSGAKVVTYTDATYSTQVEAIFVPADSTADVNGNLNPSGQPGQTYHYRALVQFTHPTSAALALQIGAHFGDESEAAANQVTFLIAGVRAASLGEIGAGNQLMNMPVFPQLPGQMPNVKKAPTWSTNVAISSSGVERRTALWAYPRWTFELNYEVLRNRPAAMQDEVQAIWELFNLAEGKRFSFLYLDGTDFVVNGEQFGTGDGSTTLFQLTRTVRSWSEPLLCPFGVTVYVNGTPTTVGLLNGGSVIFNTAPPDFAVLTWSGYFFYPCRFDQDDLTLTEIMQALWSNDGLKFISLKNLT
jgi:uncharacterized protein (TIGR02217 family)